MNYYYFFAVFHYYLGVCLSKSSQPQGVLFDFIYNINNHSLVNHYCQRFITYNQVTTLLFKNTCPLFEKSNKINNHNSRTRRQSDAGNLDIKALQTTVNDHRTMIQYLFNNSINETILMQTLFKHSRTASSLTNLRDLVDIFCIGLLIIKLIYLLLWRAGFPICDKLFAFTFGPVLNRIQKQQQQQQHTKDWMSSDKKTTSEQLKSI